MLLPSTALPLKVRNLLSKEPMSQSTSHSPSNKRSITESRSISVCESAMTGLTECAQDVGLDVKDGMRRKKGEITARRKIVFGVVELDFDAFFKRFVRFGEE
jgi:hypothetical protein